MKKGIKFRKLKRKAKNIVLWTITYIMFVMMVVSALLHAFGEPLKIYWLMYAVGFAWCGCFAHANSRGKKND